MDAAHDLAQAIRQAGHVREESAARFDAVIDDLANGRPSRGIAALIDMRNSGELREEANDRYQSILAEYRTYVAAHPDAPDAPADEGEGARGDEGGDEGRGEGGEAFVVRVPTGPAGAPAPGPAPDAGPGDVSGAPAPAGA